MEKAGQGIASGTNRTHYRPKRNVRFVDVGKTIQMQRFAVVWSQPVFCIDRESSFVLGKVFLYFPLNFGKGS
jgi:hypothetical protein